MSLFSSTAAWVTEEHRMFAEAAGRFLDDELVPNIETWVDNGVVDRDFWRNAGHEARFAAAWEMTGEVAAIRGIPDERQFRLQRSVQHIQYRKG